ncbi:SACM1L family protein [Megaselia abdita]
MVPASTAQDNVIYDDLFLYEDVEKLYLSPGEGAELMVIDRVNGRTEVQEKKVQLEGLRPSKRVCGVLGLMHLSGGSYLVLAAHRLYVGIVNGQVVWKMAGATLMPLQHQQALTSKQQSQNDTYLSMLQKILDTPYFYFSYTYDLTHTLQRLHSMPTTFNQSSLLDRADKRFVWNGYMLKNFNCVGMNRFALPLLLGFVSINQASINNSSFNWIIVTRRSVERAGTRLFCRGIDDNGHVANFVETEQIVECNGDKVSFVQTRGSMPFYWHQTPNLRYKPPPEIVPGKDHITSCSKHFDEQLAFYGRQVCINLVDQKKAEGELEKTYKLIVAQLNSPAVRYEAFDFHKECKGMKYQRANILIDRLTPELEQFSVFHLRSDGVLLSVQNGMFRTNCIDCLDRTNVIQSMFARRSLNDTFVKLGLLQSGFKFENVAPSFELTFKNVWADNADLISKQYSGTGALKTDFTRTGKRTKNGLLKDGVNSMARYYLNNFSDGFRQDAIDLFLGKYTVKSGEGSAAVPSPLEFAKGWRYGTVSF